MGERTVTLTDEQIAVLQAVVGHALDQDHDDVAGDYLLVVTGEESGGEVEEWRERNRELGALLEAAAAAMGPAGEPAEPRYPLPELTGEQLAAIEEHVRPLYGDDPQAVGVEDGTEDDHGDMITDTLHALGIDVNGLDYTDGSLDMRAMDRAQAAASYCDSEDLVDWARVVLAAWQGDPVWVRPLVELDLLSEESAKV